MAALDVAAQKSEIARSLQTPLKKGDSWFLIDAKWFRQWKKFVGFDAWDTDDVGKGTAPPGSIDNRPM
jgi:ubiquitin carboxyl-terminal hydrolase 4/11/15